MNEHWPEISLSQLATITMGQSPEAACVSTDERGLAFLQGCAEFGARVPSPKLHCSPPLRVAKAGSVLISVRAPVGTTNFADQDYCIGRGLGAVTAKPEAADNIFLLHAMEKNVGFLHRRSQGSTFLAIGSKELSALPVPALPLATQRRIAKILSTVDEAIEQTEALISKYQQIKAGLMHDLFTRGVSPDGHLRPTREQAPHLYKESPLGWIPKDWEVSTLGESCEWFSGGTPSRSKSEWWSGDFPWLTPKDMKAFELSDTSEHITKEAALFGSRVVSAGTVFIVVRGMILAHSFPVVLGLKDFAFNQDIKAVQAGNRMTSRFLAYWFVGHKDLFLKKTTEATHGTKRFDLKEISKVSIGLPKPDEQNTIVSRLDSISTRIDLERVLVAKLRQQKQGLMQDLLTGRVRVKVGEAEEQS